MRLIAGSVANNVGLNALQLYLIPVEKCADCRFAGFRLQVATYSINADCTGTASFPPNFSANIYVSPDGDSFTFVQTSPGTPNMPLVSGEEKRVSKTLISA